MANIATKRKLSLKIALLGFCIPFILLLCFYLYRVIILIVNYGVERKIYLLSFFTLILPAYYFLMPISTLCWITAAILSPKIENKQRFSILSILGVLISVAVWVFYWIYTQIP